MPAYKDKKRGTWYVKMSRTVDGQRKQILKRGFERKSDALDWEASQRNVAPSESRTFRGMMEMYFEYNHPLPRTVNSQTAMLERYFPLIDKPLSKIKKSDMMTWYLGLQREDLKPSSINLVLAVVKSVFKYANDFYEIPNVAAGLRRVKLPARKYKTWTPEQFNQFISVVDLEYYRAIFTFIYYTGCRRSEALGVKYTDFSGNTVHIRGTKTEASDRVLKLAPALIEALQPVLARCDDEQPFVFSIPEATLHGIFKRYIARSGVPDIRIHDLRHSFATNMIGSGANIVAVSKYLGHSNINQTLNTYTHLFEDADNDLINRINGIISVSNAEKSQ